MMIFDLTDTNTFYCYLLDCLEISLEVLEDFFLKEAAWIKKLTIRSTVNF